MANETNLSRIAHIKARDYIIGAISQADPSISTEVGSSIRALLVTPGAYIYAGVMDDVGSLRRNYLGNYATISRTAMDNIASNYLVERASATPAIATLRLYFESPNDADGILTTSSQYFKKANSSTAYKPVRPVLLEPQNVLVDSEGRFYTDINVISTVNGSSGVARAGEITEFTNLPVSIVSVTNIDATVGGLDEDSNESMFFRIQESLNDGTLSQISGIKSFASSGRDTNSVFVVDAGNPLMMRDEVWVNNGVPNLDREGEPYTNHTSIGSLDFDLWTGRASVLDASVDLESIKGKRIVIPGDRDYFRTILDVAEDTRTIVISGHDLYGQYDNVVVWNEAMHIGHMADVYIHPLYLSIETVTIPARTELGIFYQEEGQNPYSFSFIVPVSEIIPTLEENEYYSLKMKVGTDNEVNINNLSQNVSFAGDVITYANQSYTRIIVSSLTDEDIESIQNAELEQGDSVYLYKSNVIDIGISGDITGTPVIHIADVTAFDPISQSAFEGADIQQSAPGDYDPPGWYLINTDPAYLLSTQEEKQMIIDEKVDSPAFYPHSFTGYALRSTANLYANIIKVTNNTFAHLNGCEGRSAQLTILETEIVAAFVPEYQGGVLINASISPDVSIISLANIADADGAHYAIDREDFTYGQSQPYSRVGQPIVLDVFDNGNVLIESAVKGLAFGDSIFRLTSGPWPANISRVKITATGSDDNGASWFIPEKTYEGAVVLRIEGSDEIQVYLGSMANGQENSINTIHNDEFDYSDPSFQGYVLASNIRLTFPDERAKWTSSNIAVTYGTSQIIRDIQSSMDSSDSRTICTNTLVRSVFPSLIDTSFRFYGSESSITMQSRFIELISEAEAETFTEDNSLLINMSNIIAELDDDSTLKDFLETNFEIRVTDHLDDGEHRVRYLNPSLKTRQIVSISSNQNISNPTLPNFGQPTVNTPIAPGSTRINIRKVYTDSSSGINGRGKIYLGGVDQSKREVIPYEAIVQTDEQNYILIFRNGFQTQFEHYPYESAVVTARDYEPLLEMKGYLEVPANNRPYAREVIAAKYQSTSDIKVTSPYDPFLKGM